MLAKDYGESDFTFEKNFLTENLYQTGGVECVHILDTEAKGFYVEVETKNHVVFIMFVRLMNRAIPCYLKERMEDIYKDRKRDVSYSIIMGDFISINSDAICQEHNIGYMDRQGNYWLNFCDFHHRRTGFYPTLKKGHLMKYSGPRNKVPMPW